MHFLKLIVLPFVFAILALAQNNNDDNTSATTTLGSSTPSNEMMSATPSATGDSDSDSTGKIQHSDRRQHLQPNSEQRPPIAKQVKAQLRV
ncbi:MAG: hypothetical protein Q9176_008090 [Flavoplaca citrina]